VKKYSYQSINNQNTLICCHICCERVRRRSA